MKMFAIQKIDFPDIDWIKASTKDRRECKWANILQQ
jgi:hypothetical protein